MNGYCSTCNGELIGDGYSSVLRCEFAEEETYCHLAPDEGPVYCEEVV